MALILHNDPTPSKTEQGPQWQCCGKLFRDGPCGCPKSDEVAQLNLKAPEIRSAEALEKIHDTLTAILERLALPTPQQKRAS